MFRQSHTGVLHPHAKVPFTHSEKTVKEEYRAGDGKEKDECSLECLTFDVKAGHPNNDSSRGLVK